MTHNTINQSASPKFMDAFCALMDKDFSPALSGGGKNVAVAVSGGADSLALCFMLSDYFLSHDQDVVLHAMTVNHCLRDEAAAEGEYVRHALLGLPNVRHNILTWDHDGGVVEARLQERARAARYDLMSKHMHDVGAKFLFLGHHMNDQAETFLFRLAKGSGLDGLACMSAMQESDECGIILCRPFLSFSKVNMINYCRERELQYVNDPSNESGHFARVRLRNSMAVLEEEGLTPKRLSVASMRFLRARQALERLSENVFSEISKTEPDRIEFNLRSLLEQPEEIVLRVIKLAMVEICGADGYGSRMERLEALCSDLIYGVSFEDENNFVFRKRTLGGVVFECDFQQMLFILNKETR